MTIAFRAAASNNNGAGTTSATVTLPGTVQADDGMVMVLTLVDAGVTPTTPSGWTQLDTGTGVGTNGVKGYVYTRVAQPGDASSTVTITLSTAARWVLCVSVYSGTDTATLVNANGHTVSSGDGTSLTAPSVTTTVDGCQIVECWTTCAAVISTPAVTPPATSRVTDSDAQFVTGGISDQSQGTAGATGTTSASVNTSSAWVGFTVALQPPAGVPLGAASAVGLMPTVTAQVAVPLGSASGAGFSPAVTVQFPVGLASAAGFSPAITASVTTPLGAASAAGFTATAEAVVPLGTASAVGFAPALTARVSPPLGGASAAGFAPAYTGPLSQQRYRTVVVDQAGVAYGETVYATIGDLCDELNGVPTATVTVPIDDPAAPLFLPIQREVAIWRDGLAAPLFRGPIVRPATVTTEPAKVDFQCVDEETEALTRRGWVGHADLRVGDDILTLNIHTQQSEWQPIRRIFRYHHSGEMVSVEGRSISALVTSNHRWVVDHERDLGRLFMTDNLNDCHRVPLARPVGQQEPSPWDDDFVELVGWVLTEGSYAPRGTRIGIYQSPLANPDHCERIEKLLGRLGPWSYSTHPGSGTRCYKFSGPIASLIRAAFPRKVLTAAFVQSLDWRQRRLLFDVLIAGDGNRKGKTADFNTSDPEQAASFQMLCALLGYATTVRVQHNRPQVIRGERVTSRRAILRIYVRLQSNARVDSHKRTTVQYQGIVWCPNTVNGTFLVRRRGKVHFTGNCAGPLWYFQHRYFGGPGFPINYLLNPSVEDWAAPSHPDHWTTQSLTAAKEQGPGLVELGYSSVLLTASGSSGGQGLDNFLRQQTTVPANTEGVNLTLVGWFYIVSMAHIPFLSRGLYVEVIAPGNIVVANAQYTINAQTPQGTWVRAETTIAVAAAYTGAGGTIEVRAYCPDGQIIWDAFSLVEPESLSAAQPGGTDQSAMMAAIVDYAQGRSIDTNKSDLHIGTDCPATGIMRADLVYYFADHRGISDALSDFPNFWPDNDFAVVDKDATTRNFTTFGRLITDGATISGANTLSSSTALFTRDDLYQPVWHPNIPVGAIIVNVDSPTAVVFSGAAATATGNGLSVFIGGRRGKWRPECSLEIGRNISRINPWNQDGEQAANSVVMTGLTSGVGGEIGTAIDLTKIGGVTMEMVLSAPPPAPINTLNQFAQNALSVQAAAVEVLTVETLGNFIDTWAEGTPLVPGDILPVTASWGYLSISYVPYRIVATTLHPPTESYTLQMNRVAGV